MSKIREQIMAARQAQGVSQQEMADALGVSRVTVSNWETGKVEPSIASLQSWQHSNTQWVADLAGSILDIMFPARAMAQAEAHNGD